jgi:ubiquinone/menaquinone biosynthesis C-methylase UbiE
MDRMTWLKELRRDCEKQYDREAPLYDEQGGVYSNLMHKQFIQEFLSLLSPNSRILDAACGAGRYLPFLLEKGHSILGIDQSQGMLDRARVKFPEVPFEKIGLQEMAYHEVFDSATCMDAMENIPPEDWPFVLGNFHQALKEEGYLYFTAETLENADENGVRQAFERFQQAGLPIVYGEWPDEEVYHYHPTRQQVREWTQEAGFEIIKDDNGEIWYYHILVRRVSSPQG